ncbi:C-type lectin domain family 4 member F-like protein [Labeo rohita]|uniref:C-type lectin domain family 4 member F-like protein n=1 Tax=Labeo rohita TaxID=84645 RepID=A0A498NVE0_LABRO|nr:C-type lectin domain family 4 member F-like protein [Labeo rohita]
MPLRPSARGEPGLVRDYGGVKRGEFGTLLDLLAVLVTGVDLGVRLANLQVMKKEFNDLTTRYNTLRKWLSFYDAQSCNLSVDGWIACRGKLYLFNSDKLNWSNSRDVCVLKGADLVTITNQTEQVLVQCGAKRT